MFEVTTAWRSAFPGAHTGVLLMRGVSNPAQHPDLERWKGELEAELRAQYSGQDRVALSNHPVLRAYNDHYKRFKKSYHVQLQLESIAWKGKSIPSVSALVEAMFMAEMKNLLLTAGHDLDLVQLPLTLDVSKGTEGYTLMRGEEQILKPGDMMISDRVGDHFRCDLWPRPAHTDHRRYPQRCLYHVRAPGHQGTARGKTFAGYAGLYPGLCSRGQGGAAQSVLLNSKFEIS